MRTHGFMNVKRRWGGRALWPSPVGRLGRGHATALVGGARQGLRALSPQWAGRGGGAPWPQWAEQGGAGSGCRPRHPDAFFTHLGGQRGRLECTPRRLTGLLLKNGSLSERNDVTLEQTQDHVVSENSGDALENTEHAVACCPRGRGQTCETVERRKGSHWHLPQLTDGKLEWTDTMSDMSASKVGRRTPRLWVAPVSPRYF